MPTNPEPDYYEILGVESNATQEEIDKAFRKARRDNHPDKSSTGAWAFRLVEMAYETLKDEDSRRLYDESLKSPKAPSAPSPDTSETKVTSTDAPPPQTVKEEDKTTSSSPTVVHMNDIEPEDMVVIPQVENNITDLKQFSFLPSPKQWLTPFVTTVAVSLISLLVLGALWFAQFPKTTVFASAGFLSIAYVVLTQRKHSSRASTISALMLILGWIVVGLPVIIAGNPDAHIVYIVVLCIFFIASLASLVLLGKYLGTFNMNKKVPVSVLKKSRVYGTAKGINSEDSADLRNISDSLTPITYEKDGSFLFHLEGFRMDGKVYPVDMALLYGDKLSLISHLNVAAGKYGVTPDGNVVHVANNGVGLSHVNNSNPDVLEACSKLRKRFKNLEVDSVVVLLPYAGVVEGYVTDGTALLPRANVFSYFEKEYASPISVVRRDVIALLTKSLSM